MNCYYITAYDDQCLQGKGRQTAGVGEDGQIQEEECCNAVPLVPHRGSIHDPTRKQRDHQSVPGMPRRFVGGSDVSGTSFNNATASFVSSLYIVNQRSLFLFFSRSLVPQPTD